MYLAAIDRYQRMSYARCGRSGLQLPRSSLGALKNLQFNQDELRKIDHYAVDSDLNIWSPRGVDGR
jgi:aryl-alcohol dehydrogenase-like predicted oxidoreductase